MRGPAAKMSHNAWRPSSQGDGDQHGPLREGVAITRTTTTEASAIRGAPSRTAHVLHTPFAMHFISANHENNEFSFFDAVRHNVSDR
jgi:hypothetical protein